MASFNWTQLIPEVGTDYAHVATTVAVSTVLLGLSLRAKASLGKGETAVLPADKLSLRGVLEAILEFFVNQSDALLGKENRKHVPVFCSIFFFILINNFFGLIPGMTPATENLNTNVAVGLFVFFYYNFLGFKEHGLGYLKQFAGPMLLLAPFMFPIEMISHLIRPMSLGIRLFGNMQADHILLGVFTDLTYVVIPVAFYILGIFVSFVQAFIFAFLTMIYVNLAISHDH